MSIVTVLGYFLVSTCVVAAIYAAFSRDLLRASIAFFVELASLGGVLLTLNADFLALIVFAVGLLGTMLVITFSSVIMGSLKESFTNEFEGGRGGVLARLMGMLLGLAVGGAIAWAFLTAPFIDRNKELPVAADQDVRVIGRMLLGEQLAVFELLGVMLLVVVVGAGLLLRKPSNAD